MVPLGPLRLSTARLCPMLWPILSAMARAMMSVVLPAANGTIPRIGLFGELFCARGLTNKGGTEGAPQASAGAWRAMGTLGMGMDWSPISGVAGCRLQINSPLGE